MSTSATGRLLDENNEPLQHLMIVVRDVSAIFPSELGWILVDLHGDFRVDYEADSLVSVFGSRTLEFRILDKSHRVVARFEKSDVEAGTLALGNVKIPKADATGWLVTLGTGKPTPEVRQGNAIGLLVDNVVAWKRVAETVKSAQTSIEFMQLAFDIPADFKQDGAQEEPQMVLHFDPALSAVALRPVGAKDLRPERLLLDAISPDRRVAVRVLLDHPVALDPHLLGVFLVPVLGLIVLGIGALLQAFGVRSSFDEVRNYYKPTPMPQRRIQGATTSFLGPTHAKLAIVDGTKAISIASPFDQGYYGDHTHAIDDPRRGNKDTVPIHDVSLAVTGPAVFDLHQTYRLHWNDVTEASEHLAKIEVPSRQTEIGDLDALASLQVIRTLDTGRFEDPEFPGVENGEKGVLEAYLRAIAQAQSYIYLENQYVTNDAIGTALLEALIDPIRPNLNVIVLMNIHPDIPCYPRWQRKLVTRIREGMAAAGLSEEQRKRFGAFTRWTHEAAPPGGSKPRIVPNYIHSKVGIVDGKWATLGSANLDGASLEYLQLVHVLQSGDVRNTEVNLLILNGIEGQPETPAVDLLRRRLWAEHLGLEDNAGVPNPLDALLDTPPAGGWVQLWHRRAEQKLAGLGANPGAPIRPRILPWPNVDRTLDAPRSHLAALLGKKPNEIGLDPIAETRRFSFKKGTWRDESPALD